MKWTVSGLYYSSYFPSLDTQLCALLPWALVLFIAESLDLALHTTSNYAVGSSKQTLSRRCH